MNLKKGNLAFKYDLTNKALDSSIYMYLLDVVDAHTKDNQHVQLLLNIPHLLPPHLLSALLIQMLDHIPRRAGEQRAGQRSGHQG